MAEWMVPALWRVVVSLCRSGVVCASSGRTFRRVRSNVKQKTVAARLPEVQKWHRAFKLMLATSRVGVPQDPKWGCFPPEWRYNTDQVPFMFANQPTTTYADKGSKTVHVLQPQGEANSKRFCTVQLTLRMEGEQVVPPIIIFAGQGLHITAVERASWDPRVVVMFQRKAWADTAVVGRIVDEVFIPKMKALPGRPVLLLQDNLGSQTDEGNRRKLAAAHILPWFYGAGHTDLTQV